MQQLGTYQTRISDYGGVNRSAGTLHWPPAPRFTDGCSGKLFADVAAGRSPASLKRVYLQRYGIPARMFNAVRVSLEGRWRRYGSSRSCVGMLWGGALRGRSGRFPMPPNVADGIRSIRRNGGWPICESGWLHWKATSLRAGCGCASGPSGCGGSSMPLRLTITPTIRNG